MRQGESLLPFRHINEMKFKHETSKEIRNNNYVSKKILGVWMVTPLRPLLSSNTILIFILRYLFLYYFVLFAFSFLLPRPAPVQTFRLILFYFFISLPRFPLLFLLILLRDIYNIIPSIFVADLTVYLCFFFHVHFDIEL